MHEAWVCIAWTVAKGAPLVEGASSNKIGKILAKLIPYIYCQADMCMHGGYYSGN
jgi:hypothetical protein